MTMSENPLTLEAFAEWCETKPADEKYDWLGNCAVEQYSQFLGRYDEWDDRHQRDEPWWAAMSAGPACEEPYTFGALAARLRSGAYSL
jgi:hypothetical protein